MSDNNNNIDNYINKCDDILKEIENSDKNLEKFKEYYLKLYNNITKIKELYKDENKINIILYNELTAEISKKLNANFILRGLRNTTDFEFENSISQINKDINKDLETVFLITSPKLAPISSTIIRDVVKYGGDINKYLPYKKMLVRYGKKYPWYN